MVGLHIGKRVIFLFVYGFSGCPDYIQPRFTKTTVCVCVVGGRLQSAGGQTSGGWAGRCGERSAALSAPVPPAQPGFSSLLSPHSPPSCSLDGLVLPIQLTSIHQMRGYKLGKHSAPGHRTRNPDWPGVFHPHLSLAECPSLRHPPSPSLGVLVKER